MYTNYLRQHETFIDCSSHHQTQGYGYPKTDIKKHNEYNFQAEYPEFESRQRIQT